MIFNESPVWADPQIRCLADFQMVENNEDWEIESDDGKKLFEKVRLLKKRYNWLRDQISDFKVSNAALEKKLKDLEDEFWRKERMLIETMNDREKEREEERKKLEKERKEERERQNEKLAVLADQLSEAKLLDDEMTREFRALQKSKEKMERELSFKREEYLNMGRKLQVTGRENPQLCT